MEIFLYVGNDLWSHKQNHFIFCADNSRERKQQKKCFRRYFFVVVVVLFCTLILNIYGAMKFLQKNTNWKSILFLKMRKMPKKFISLFFTCPISREQFLLNFFFPPSNTSSQHGVEVTFLSFYQFLSIFFQFLSRPSCFALFFYQDNFSLNFFHLFTLTTAVKRQWCESTDNDFEWKWKWIYAEIANCSLSLCFPPVWLEKGWKCWFKSSDRSSSLLSQVLNLTLTSNTIFTIHSASTSFNIHSMIMWRITLKKYSLWISS